MTVRNKERPGHASVCFWGEVEKGQQTTLVVPLSTAYWVYLSTGADCAEHCTCPTEPRLYTRISIFLLPIQGIFIHLRLFVPRRVSCFLRRFTMVNITEKIKELSSRKSSCVSSTKMSIGLRRKCEGLRVRTSSLLRE